MIEYQVRPVSRFIVTKYENDGASSSSGVVGEFDSHRRALDVAHAVAAYDGGEFVHTNHLGDAPALLRNIADQVSQMIPVKRGLVFIELENGGMLAYGLGKEIGDIGELVEKGVEEINALAESTLSE
jgi:hypothetical protein